jgi:hypothetical protein
MEKGNIIAEELELDQPITLIGDDVGVNSMFLLFLI